MINRVILSPVQAPSFAYTQAISDNIAKYGKITAIVVAIFAALAAIVYVYRRLSAGQIDTSYEFTENASGRAPAAPFAKMVDETMHEVSENIFTNRSFSVKKATSRVEPHHAQILNLLNELVAEFEKRHPQSYRLTYGQQVPAYFAQVKDQSDDYRKYLSLCGIRNMLRYGEQIIHDFAQQDFLGGAHHYGSMDGLNAFKHYTGNTVDLDTQLDPQITQPDEAINKAKELIIAFGKRCGLQSPSGELTAEEVARQLPHRKLDLPYPGQPIHMAMDHTDRSNHGIWSRQHPTTGRLDHYVNVPNCDVVLSATLRFPYMVAELVWRAKAANGGKMSNEFLDDLFARGISDMCFNDKIKAFSAFHLDWMAQFDGVAETPEETVQAKILNGDFGDALKDIGPDKAIKEAFNPSKLAQFFDPFEFRVKVDGVATPKDQWIETIMPVCIDKLTEKKLWKAALYQSHKETGDHIEQDNDYFLLDEASLKSFLKQYYHAVIVNEEFY